MAWPKLATTVGMGMIHKLAMQTDHTAGRVMGIIIIIIAIIIVIIYIMEEARRGSS